ncbi:hypothetical protein BJV82DRAFT_599006 [Fennellomyces sp. T-0311]|nr:hypothetical protein BJV82DRAFT_599006 [Fennellomyces sp. T-0311]
MTVDDHPFTYTDYTSFLQLIEQQLALHHDRTFIRYQVPGVELEFKPITYGEFNRVANYLAHQWAPQLADVTCVGFLGDEPIQCMLAMLAMFKLRRLFFAISTRVPGFLITKLLAETNTQCLIVPEDQHHAAVEHTKDLPDFQVKPWEPFDVERLIKESEGYDSNEFNHSDKPAPSLDDIILLLHSSGSTGPPKPIHFSNRYLLLLIQVFVTESRETWEECSVDSEDVISVLVPVFHSSGVMAHWISMMFGAHAVLFRGLPAPPQYVLSTIETQGVTVLLAPPMSLKAMAEYLRNEQVEESTVAALGRIKFSMFGGDQLVMGAGELLHAKGLNVRCAHGISETGFVAIADLSRDNKTWYTVKPVKDFLDYYHWEPVDEGIYHCMIKGDCPGLCPSVVLNEQGLYETTDLFREEPPNSGYYRHIGRNTDVFVMSNGKKIYPTLMENEIRGCNIVKGCTVIGEDRSHTAILVEINPLRVANYDPEQIKAEVYEAVKAANKQLPEDSAVTVPELVYIVPEGKVLPTISKGTVSRKSTLQAFKEEIEKLYGDFLESASEANENGVAVEN